MIIYPVGTALLGKLLVHKAIRQEIARALQDSLAEKELLLRELYHRTRNNIQVIASMLELQASHTVGEQARRILERTGGRLKSMALMHEKLYESGDLSKIRLDEYTRELAEMVCHIYEANPGRIALSYDMEPIPALIDIATPCALVLHELILNALEHAFPDGRSGEIRISLHREAPGEIVLTVADNGVGVPEEWTPQDTDTFGLHAVMGIVEHQLQGQIVFEKEQGLTCRVRFRDDLYAARV